MGILQILRFMFGKFRILEILNSHPCINMILPNSPAFQTVLNCPVSLQRFEILFCQDPGDPGDRI